MALLWEREEVINNIMNTTSILSENFAAETGIYIKGGFRKSEYKSNTNGSAGKAGLKKEKAIVRYIFHSYEKNKSLKEKLTYTIQHGDNKRLNKDGVLRVYNMNQPLDIPVGKLLGNWNKSHIGVTLVVLNGQWSVGEEFIRNPVHKQERGLLVALRDLLKFAMA